MVECTQEGDGGVAKGEWGEAKKSKTPTPSSMAWTNGVGLRCGWVRGLAATLEADEEKEKVINGDGVVGDAVARAVVEVDRD